MQPGDGRQVRDGVTALPGEAQTLVARIDAMLAQAEPLLASGASDEAAYALRETERRYLPDTLNTFAAIPPALRDAGAESMLVEQLRLLERATAQRLTMLGENAQTQFSANGAFLTERFGPAETLPDAPAQIDAPAATPASLVRHILQRIETPGDARPLIERTAAQLGAAFPAIVTVKRGGLFGNGPVEAVALDVPRRDDVLRYALARTPRGDVEATVTRFLRGIKNKTLVVGVDEWSQGLADDLAAYVERERGARDTLTRLFRETR